jgi:hypothetical protein
VALGSIPITRKRKKKETNGKFRTEKYNNQDLKKKSLKIEPDGDVMMLKFVRFNQNSDWEESDKYK